MSLKRWDIDSCPCVIFYDDAAFTFVSWERRCNEHKLLDRQPLFDGILLHNQSFNSQYSTSPTPTRQEVEAEKERITTLKIAETDRIESDGPTERK